MPIISISRIQHRYGLSENLPQLAAAELGWAIDKRKLYIGNGPTSEGAPSIGNTEILTQYSNLLEVTGNSYIYKDVAVGYEARTGVTALAPTTRSLQAKLDDLANVRDYGATGDGVSDDTDAINRALADLYTRDANPAIRRNLYFPAGVYLVSDVIKIPAYASLIGEGMNCTIIRATNDLVDCVARTADSKQQVGATIGANGATIPSFITVRDLTFDANRLNMNVFIIDSTTDSRFDRVKFTGNLDDAPSTATGAYKALAIYSTAINQTNNISFDSCDFSGTIYGVVLDDDMQNISINASSFRRLFRGLKIGEETSGSGSSVVGPRGFRVTNSLFDEIYDVGFYVYEVGTVTSAFNTYLDVGNQNIGIPAVSVIVFGQDGNVSIGDSFARTDAEDLLVPRINYSNYSSVYINAIDGVYIGRRKLESGSVLTLANNTSSPTTTGINFPLSLRAQRVLYIAFRNGNVRYGHLDISATASGITLSDTFTEDGTDIGLVLTAVSEGANVVIKYTTSNTGENITFSYSVDRITI